MLSILNFAKIKSKLIKDLPVLYSYLVTPREGERVNTVFVLNVFSAK